MSIERYFPNFHPLKGKRQEVPVYVSQAQVKEAQDFLSKHSSEEKLIEAASALKRLPDSAYKEIFPNESLFPTKKGFSHRACIGKLYKLELFADHEHPKAFISALVIIIKINQLLNIIEYTFDYQLIEHPIRHEDFLKSCEVADIALAISDAFGEFKLALGNIDSSITDRQDYEEQIISERALRANDIKHEPLRQLYIKICRIFENEKLYKKNEFNKPSSGKINYSAISKFIFWSKLVESERKLFPTYKNLSKEISKLGSAVNESSVNEYCKNNDIKFNPYYEIVKKLSECHQSMQT